jgi:hypothetical protein
MAPAVDDEIPELMTLNAAADELGIGRTTMYYLARNGVVRFRPIGARKDGVVRPAEVARVRPIIAAMDPLPRRLDADATVDLDPAIPDLVNMTEAAAIRDISKQALSLQYQAGKVKGKDVIGAKDAVGKLVVFRREVAEESRVRTRVLFAALFRTGAGAFVLGPSYKTEQEATQASERSSSTALEFVAVVPQFTETDLPNWEAHAAGVETPRAT